MALVLNRRSVTALVAVAVLLVGWGFSMASPLRGVTYQKVTTDDRLNDSQFPHCDNGGNWFLTRFVEYIAGPVEGGYQCTVKGVSAAKVKEWTRQKLVAQGIDPLTASSAEWDAAEMLVLKEWEVGSIP